MLLMLLSISFLLVHSWRKVPSLLSLMVRLLLLFLLILPSFSFNATALNYLSFLNCNFVFPSSPLSPSLSDPPSPLLDLSDAALTTVFPQVSLTPELWHCHSSHLGIQATQAVLMKNYVTGIEHTGSFAYTHCIPCLVGKTPQHSFLHLGHCTSKPGSLLHIDMCGPFPVLSPQQDTYFLSILYDCTNFGFVGPLQQKSDAYKFYCCTEASIKHTQVATVYVDGTPELCEDHMGTHLWH